jgi:V/A-type H+/Na+-transporting ATPase subunit D
MSVTAPTRLNLLRTQRRLEHMARGRDLLRRKREALVTELFQLARPAADARALIAEATLKAYPALLDALTAEGQAGLKSLGWPTRGIEVELRHGMVWGIAVADIVARPPVLRSLAARGVAPGGSAGATALAANGFERLTDLLLEAAPRELLLQRLGQALAQTSRQVNTLERRLTPELRADLTRIRAVLEEREREEHVRLERLKRRHVNDSFRGRKIRATIRDRV